jgi:hypothetical protein
MFAAATGVWISHLNAILNEKVIVFRDLRIKDLELADW